MHLAEQSWVQASNVWWHVLFVHAIQFRKLRAWWITLMHQIQYTWHSYTHKHIHILLCTGICTNDDQHKLLRSAFLSNNFSPALYMIPHSDSLPQCMVEQYTLLNLCAW